MQKIGLKIFADFMVHLLDGLFRLGNRRSYLFQRQSNVYGTFSFASIRRNLLTTSFSYPPLCYCDFFIGNKRMFAELAIYRFAHVPMPLIKLNRDTEVTFKRYHVSEDNKSRRGRWFLRKSLKFCC